MKTNIATIILFALCTVALTGCGSSNKENAEAKDSNVLYLPGLNGDDKLPPTVINLHNSCHKTDSEQ